MVQQSECLCVRIPEVRFPEREHTQYLIRDRGLNLRCQAEVKDEGDTTATKCYAQLTHAQAHCHHHYPFKRPSVQLVAVK